MTRSWLITAGLLLSTPAAALDVEASWLGIERSGDLAFGEPEVFEWHEKRPSWATRKVPQHVRLTVVAEALPELPGTLDASRSIQVHMVLERLRGDRPVEVLSRPSLVFTDGERAEIQQGMEDARGASFPYFRFSVR